MTHITRPVASPRVASAAALCNGVEPIMLFCALTCSAGPHTSACQQIQSTRTAKTAARIVRRAYRLKRPAERFVTLITNAPAWMSTSALWWLPHRHATCSAVCPTPFAVDGLTPAAMSLLISAGKFFWATESRSTREWRNASASTDRTQTSRGGELALGLSAHYAGTARRGI